MLAEYWLRSRGVTRHVVTHIHEHLKNDRDPHPTEASRALATGRCIGEQETISLLIVADSETLLRGTVMASVADK
jgi:hypothetical protein